MGLDPSEDKALCLVAGICSNAKGFHKPKIRLHILLVRR